MISQIVFVCLALISNPMTAWAEQQIFKPVWNNRDNQENVLMRIDETSLQEFLNKKFIELLCEGLEGYVLPGLNIVPFEFKWPSMTYGELRNVRLQKLMFSEFSSKSSRVQLVADGKGFDLKDTRRRNVLEKFIGTEKRKGSFSSESSSSSDEGASVSRKPLNKDALIAIDGDTIKLSLIGLNIMLSAEYALGSKKDPSTERVIPSSTGRNVIRAQNVAINLHFKLNKDPKTGKQGVDVTRSQAHYGELDVKFASTKMQVGGDIAVQTLSTFELYITQLVEDSLKTVLQSGMATLSETIAQSLAGSISAAASPYMPSATTGLNFENFLMRAQKDELQFYTNLEEAPPKVQARQ
jgi:hypothetical protein